MINDDAMVYTPFIWSNSDVYLYMIIVMKKQAFLVNVNFKTEPTETVAFCFGFTKTPCF
jgi:hypothetical protein